jgi:hypothetical protein
MTDDPSVALSEGSGGRRFVSPLYRLYAAVFAGMVLIGALLLAVAVTPKSAACAAAAVAVLLAARLAWLAVYGGATLDAARRLVTVRGLVQVSRVPRQEVSEVEVRSHGGSWPRGTLRGSRTVRLRGLSFRHTHRFGRGGGLSCPSCFADRQTMLDLAVALDLPAIEHD